MARCLWCGNELTGNGHFCKSSGHHILMKKQLLRELEAGTITPERLEWLKFFKWMPGQVVEAAPKVPKQRKARQVGHPVKFRKFGVELECICPKNAESSIISDVTAQGYKMQHTGYTHQHVDYWKSLYDSSVRPAPYERYDFESKEFVSPAFDSQSGLDQVADICKVIVDHGGKVNDTAGLHVHLDASDLTAQEIAKIVFLYGKLESKINTLLPKSRRRNYYCKSVKRFCNYVNRSGFEWFDSVEKINRVLGTRYLKVNIQAYVKHGTVEFRQLNGTLDAEYIRKWITLCTRIVEFVKEGGDVTQIKGNLYKILGCERDEIDFWNSVKASLAA